MFILYFFCNLRQNLIINIVFMEKLNKSKSKRRDVSALSEFGYNKENPFLKQSLEVIQKNIVRKYKTASNTSQRAILQAIDPNTGELLGHTQFIRQIEVDEENFAKFYLSRFPKFFELKPQAIKVFGYILNQLIPNKDEFIFIMEECKEYTGYKSDNSIRIGLTNLLASEVIAKGRIDNLYYINPMFVFNGNRITFADTYVRMEKAKKQIDNTKTIDLNQFHPNQTFFNFEEEQAHLNNSTEE